FLPFALCLSSFGLSLNQDNKDWYIPPQRSQRYAGKDLSLSPSARLCALRGWTNVTWSDLDRFAIASMVVADLRVRPGLRVRPYADRQTNAAQPQSADGQIEAGNRVYLGSCSMTYCHGAGGMGGGAPKLRDREFTAEYLTHLITEGVPGTSMPAF